MGLLTASVLAQAFALVFDPYVLWVILASAIFGLFVGAVPGLTIPASGSVSQMEKMSP